MTGALSTKRRTGLAARLLARLPGGQRAAAGQAGWVAISAAGQQAVRLGSNIALARLLGPEVLGMMVIVNALRSGGELLSDLGISQNIVVRREGDQPDFYNTAWTMQVIRGAILFAVGLTLAWPMAIYYGRPDLLQIVPVGSTLFLITGFMSPALFLLQKRSEVGKLSAIDFAFSAIPAVLSVVLALFMRNVWSLLLALILSNVIMTAITFRLIPGLIVRFRIDRTYASDIFHFGKWIFASSVVYFLATNFDRLYLSQAIPLALLGVYGIARTYADAATSVVQRAAHVIVMPRIAASDLRRADLAGAIGHSRMLLLLGIASALAAAIVLSDALIFLFYDDRYRAAALMMPILLVGTWFAALAALSEAIVLGLGLPKAVAVSNAIKFAWIGASVPLAMQAWGLLPALACFAAGDFVRYVVLSLLKARHGLSFVRQDVFGTAAFAAVTLGLLECAHLLGATTGFATALGIG